MKLAIQRVTKASVAIGGEVVGEIDMGLFVLVGMSQKDTDEKVTELASKLTKLRVMADGDGKMNLAVKDMGHLLSKLWNPTKQDSYMICL